MRVADSNDGARLHVDRFRAGRSGDLVSLGHRIDDGWRRKELRDPRAAIAQDPFGVGQQLSIRIIFGQDQIADVQIFYDRTGKTGADYQSRQHFVQQFFYALVTIFGTDAGVQNCHRAFTNLAGNHVSESPSVAKLPAKTRTLGRQRKGDRDHCPPAMRT